MLLEHTILNMKMVRQILKVSKQTHLVKTWNVFKKFSLRKDEKQNLKSWLDLNPDLSKECSDVCLIIGSNIVQDIRHDIENTLGYHCSAGIAQNKVLSVFEKELIFYKNKIYFVVQRHFLSCVVV